jgi:hypothetical protein
VKAIRDYVFLDKSSWLRPGRERCIWNGATKNNHNNAVAGPYSTSNAQAPSRAIPASGLGSLGARGKALNVIWESVLEDGEFKLLFFETAKGTSAACRPATDAIRSDAHKINDVVNDFKWLAGTYALSNLDGVDCDYKNDGNNPGALWCEDCNDTTTPKDKKQKSIKISCQVDVATNNKLCLMKDKRTWHTPVVFCEW